MTPIEPAGTLADALAATVRRYADRVAVTAADRSLTYAELDRAAETLAGGVLDRAGDAPAGGVLDSAADAPAGEVRGGAGDAPAGGVRGGAGRARRRVAILLERSADLVVATVAAVRAGATYVPLDPAHPPARLATVLAAARPALVVTSRALRDRLPADVPVLCVDEPMPPAGPAAGAPECAYVLFTSGTTGRPKGVQVSHANVLSLFRATDAVLDTGPDDVWTMFHSYAFDFSVWEMWGPLLHGGRLVVVPEAVSRDPARFRRLLRDEGVTVLSQTPTAFGLLVDEDRRHPDRLPVRRVVLGGEALRFGDLRPWIDRYGDRVPELVNMYGITETTVHTTYRRVTAADLDEPASLIGRPLPGTGIRLLDEDLAPVPPGRAGEIVVVGPGVGLGYLDRPELTRERFVDLPGAGGRGYRSGDRARRRPDGDLEYLGRADDQVKIRGFRIEPGDVEAALARHPAVRAAAVARRRTAAGEDVLAGYVVGDEVPDGRELRAYLAGVLPDHMVPATVTRLTALPLTANGKLDRAALPDPAVPERAGGRAPRSLREELVCRLFGQVLGRPAVDPDDDFFELGAHSLSAVQVINRMRVVLGAEVSLPDLFRARTAAAVARLATPDPGGDRSGFWAGVVGGPEGTGDRSAVGLEAVRGPVERVRVPLGADLRDRLAELARTSVTTEGIVLHAGVAALLAGTDPLIGVVTAAGTTLPTRVDASGDTSFATLLQRVRAGTLAAHDHADVPLPAGAARPRVAVGGPAGTDLSFWFEERDVVVEHRTDVPARDLGARLVALLTAAVASVGTPLHQLAELQPGPDQPLPERTRRAIAAALDVRPGSIDGAFLDLLAGDDAFAPMVPLRSAGDGAPLFCIHPGSGLCWSYVGLLAHLPPDVPVHGLQAPGLLHPDQAPPTLGDMAADYAARIRAEHPEGPYHLLGWSFGGVVAVETAVRLRAAGAEVGLLALLDSAPRLPPQPAAEPVPGELLPGGVRSRLAALLRTASHHRRLFAAHLPTPYDGDLLFVRAAAGPGPTAADWADLVTGHVHEHPIPATHTEMLDPEPLRHLAPILAAGLRLS